MSSVAVGAVHVGVASELLAATKTVKSDGQSLMTGPVASPTTVSTRILFKLKYFKENKISGKLHTYA